MKRCVVLVAAFIAAACSTPRPEMPVTPPQEVASSPVVRKALPPAPSPDTARTMTAPPAVPAGTLYVCVVEGKGERQQTAIEFTPRVAELCRKHPEMGVCQYEREICRSHGGRVFAANGAEITKLTETEYDKRVMRVRFRAD
ncbi:MAG TPA: hypothetical protein VMU79_12305 [Casimicrobiaceae bacterium]|jgi:hypothetical protein|nr:hypothetical protein [Casimicrobiaceae bacterium]